MRLRFGNMIAGTALVLLLATWAMIGSASAAVIADSQTGFSGVQGTNGWTYGYLSSTGSQGMFSNYNAAETMYDFGSAGAWLGDNGERVIKEGQHPGYDGTTTYTTVRRWTSDISGVVQISGQLAKLDNGSGNAASDGVVGSVYLNTTEKYSNTLASSDTSGVNYSFFAQIKVGDTINFLLDPKANHYCDATKFTGTIANAKVTTVDLADIVGGGNGHGTGIYPNGYNLATGAQGLAGDGYSGNGFQVVTPTNSFIDGVFVPNVSGTNTQITSTGINVDIAGVTDSTQWFGVRNSAADTGANNGILDGVNYDNVDGHTLIQMHANGGITFDLDAIRAANDGELLSFSTIAGLATTGTNAQAGFKVYIDGVLKSSQDVTLSTDIGKGYSITQDISSGDRFLTLVSTDINSFSCDGIIFADPRLTFASAIPEPSSLILLGCGLFGLIAYAWRKRRS